MFGLFFIYVVGAIIITLSYTLEPCLRLCHRRHIKKCEDRGLEHAGTYKDVEWTTNNTLQLLRFAHENAGVDSWRRCADDIPVVDDPATPLCALDLREAAHPRLSRERTTMSGLTSSGSSDNVIQEVDATGQETCPSVVEYPRTSCADDNPAQTYETVQRRPAALWITPTGSVWLESPRPISPLSMSEFGQDYRQRVSIYADVFLRMATR